MALVRDELGACPDEDELVAVVEGGLEPTALQAVLEHVDGCATCRAVVAALGRGDDTTGPFVEAGPPLPERIGRFECRGALGRGSMGVVLRAWDTLLQREVAIKLASTSCSEVEVARQLREARALAGISHDNVVEIYDVGLESGRVYLAMELIEGSTLSAWVRVAPRSVDVRLDRLIAAGRGLAAVHARGLVHRDFKPDNVMVGDDGRVRVADFGLVRTRASPRSRDDTAPSHDGQDIEDGSLTDRRWTVGTPVYMAPEQMRGGAVDGRADQFAFCVTAYEVLSGQRPFPWHPKERLDAIVHRRIGPVLPREVPRSVRATLTRGLSARPEDRFDSMEALLAAMNRRNGRRWVGVASVGLVAPLAATAPDGPSAPQCAPTGAQASVEARRGRLATTFSEAQGDPAVWERIAETLDDYAQRIEATAQHGCELPQRAAVLACLGDRRDRLEVVMNELESGGTAADGWYSAAALPDVEACLGADAQGAEHGTARERVKDALARAQVELADGHEEQALQIARTALDATADAGVLPRRAPLRLVMAFAMRRLGRGEQAAEELRQAYFDAVAEGWDAVALDAAMERAKILGKELADPEQGLAWLRHGTSAAGASLVLQPRWRAAIADTEGSLLWSLERKGEALERFEAAVAFANAAPEQTAHVAGAMHDHLAVALAADGQLDAALTQMELALALEQQRFGDDSPGAVSIRGNLGALALKADRVEDAERYLRAAIATEGGSVPQGSPLLINPWRNLGEALRRRGELVDAEDALLQARTRAAAHRAEDHPERARITLALAQVVAEQGRRDQARSLCQRAVEALDPNAPGADEILARAHAAIEALSRPASEAGD